MQNWGWEIFWHSMQFMFIDGASSISCENNSWDQTLNITYANNDYIDRCWRLYTNGGVWYQDCDEEYDVDGVRKKMVKRESTYQRFRNEVIYVYV